MLGSRSCAAQMRKPRKCQGERRSRAPSVVVGSARMYHCENDGDTRIDMKFDDSTGISLVHFSLGRNNAGYLWPSLNKSGTSQTLRTKGKRPTMPPSAAARDVNSSLALPSQIADQKSQSEPGRHTRSPRTDGKPPILEGAIIESRLQIRKNRNQRNGLKTALQNPRREQRRPDVPVLSPFVEPRRGIEERFLDCAGPTRSRSERGRKRVGLLRRNDRSGLGRPTEDPVTSCLTNHVGITSTTILVLRLKTTMLAPITLR